MSFFHRGLVATLAVLFVGACDPTTVPDAGGGLDVPVLDAPLGDGGTRDGGTPPDVRAPDAVTTTCSVPADCQDGVFCNGAEACAPGTMGADARGCVAGPMPCIALADCDEAGTRCASAACDAPTTGCTRDAVCDDGVFCNGTERCVAGACTPGTAVACTMPAECVESARACGVPCTRASDCDDGLFCNGSEYCDDICVAGTPPDCGARACVEAQDACACTGTADCDDGLYCNGVDYCRTDTRVCDSLPVVCAGGSSCLEALNRCAAGGCTMSSQCDDGVASTCERCDVPTGRCVSCPIDADRDGADSMATGGTDCDDADPLRTPGRPEVCDAMDVDEDCDGTTFGSRDSDADGAIDAACCNVVSFPPICGDDCNDARIGVNPTATEACNGLDDDCDGGTDEAVTGRVYRDRDGDGDGDESCPADLCPGAPGWAATPGDCDDARTSIGIGSTICDPAGDGVLVCAGGWGAQPCPVGTSCRPQPGGTGLCL